MKTPTLTGAQIKAGRALAGWNAEQLAEASGVSVGTIRRAEADGGLVRMISANVAAIVRALESAGVICIPEDGGGLGVRLRAPRG